MRLPASSESLPAVAPGEGRQPIVHVRHARPMSVLVVDDGVDVAESTAIVLRVTGCEVHLAHDGTSALESVLRLSPDVVLLDIGLPGMDGYQVAEQIRARARAQRHTAASGFGGTGGRSTATDRRRRDLTTTLVKPIDPIALMELMRAQHGMGHRSGSVPLIQGTRYADSVGQRQSGARNRRSAPGATSAMARS